MARLVARAAGGKHQAAAEHKSICCDGWAGDKVKKSVVEGKDGWFG